jgi:hypothetical protein
MKHPLRHHCLPLCLLACAMGCSHDEVAPPEVAAAVRVQAPSPPTSSPPKAESAAPAPELANPNEPKAVAEFTPPFPDRLELFEAPKRAQGTVKRDDEHGATVELKGFINVDEPKVVLSIDGVISPVAEGGEKYGVQVIAIQPPSVVLQRGRNRWTATLE